MTNTSILNSATILFLSTAASALLSGCQQDTPDVAPTQTNMQITKPVFCADLGEDALNDRGQADCALDSDDGSGLILNVKYGAPKDGDEYGEAQIEIKTAAADGTAQQTITETSEFVYGFPTLQDLDGDGRNELLVPLMTGNVNTVYAVWRGTPETHEYTRAGEISGVSFEAKNNGMFSASSRGSAASWATSYYKFIDGNITNIATAMIELPDSEDGVEKCTVRDDGGLALIDLTLAQAQDKFCG